MAIPLITGGRFVHAVGVRGSPSQTHVACVVLVGLVLTSGVAAVLQVAPLGGSVGTPGGGPYSVAPANGIQAIPKPVDSPSGNASLATWPAVQVLFLLETTPYDGAFDPTDHNFGLDPCLGAGSNQPCEESNGVPFFVRYAQEIASGIASAHRGVNITFGLADYFATGDGFDDGDGAEYHVDVGEFAPADQFGSAVNATFGTEVAPNGTYADSDMNDSLLHSSSITALYGSLNGYGLNWSTAAHHVVVQIGSTAPRAPGYAQNYSVSAWAGAANLSASNASSSTCEPAYRFVLGTSPNCEGWLVSQDGNGTHSIAALAADGASCVDSVGGSCTVDVVDLWTTPTDPASAGWPSRFASIGGGPNGSVVRNDSGRILTAGCGIANATGGSWDGPDFYSCSGVQGTLNFSGLNSSFPGSGRLYRALLNASFGDPTLATVYSLVFNETGLPAGANWSVEIAGISRSSKGPQVSFTLWNGTYDYSITPVPGYQAQWQGTAHLLGEGVTVRVAFVPFNYTVAFTATGLPAGTIWGVVLVDSSQTSTASVIAFQVPNGTYAYSVPTVPGFWTAPRGNVTVVGGGHTVVIRFDPVTYPVTFHEVGLPPAQSWTVSLGGFSTTSATSDIVFSEPNGSYPYRVGSVGGFRVGGQANLMVSGAAVNVTIMFQPFLYPIDLVETGLAPETNWSVILDVPPATNLSNPSPCLSPCNWTAWSDGASSVRVLLGNGTYSFTAAASGYAAVTGSVVLENGSPDVVPLVFHALQGGAPTVFGLPPIDAYLVIGSVLLVVGVGAGLAMHPHRHPYRKLGREGRIGPPHTPP